MDRNLRHYAASPIPARTLRVDGDVLRWFRERGPGYQSRMNAVLRSYMVAIQGRREGD